MRSSRGPESRPRYRFTSASEHRHRPEGWPYQPHLQGFMAATSMNRLGKTSVPDTREIWTFPSSMGCRSTSRVSFWNSGSSSRKRTPLWAREISPGRGGEPPPERPITEMVWWGERKGRRVRRGSSLVVRPRTEWIWVHSKASRSVRSGRMEGSLRASMDLPDPGGPIMAMLWPPAAAISRARFTGSWPFTSAKSGPDAPPGTGTQGSAGGMGTSPRRWAASWATFSTG